MPNAECELSSRGMCVRRDHRPDHRIGASARITQGNREAITQCTRRSARRQLSIWSVHADASPRRRHRLCEHQVDRSRKRLEDGARLRVGDHQLGVSRSCNRDQRERARGQTRQNDPLQYDGAGSGGAATVSGPRARLMRITRPAASRQSRPDVMNAIW